MLTTLCCILSTNKECAQIFICKHRYKYVHDTKLQCTMYHIYITCICIYIYTYIYTLQTLHPSVLCACQFCFVLSLLQNCDYTISYEPVCTHTYICICVCIYIFIYICIYILRYIYSYSCIYFYLFAYLFIHTYIHVPVSTYVFAFACILLYMSCIDMYVTRMLQRTCGRIIMGSGLMFTGKEEADRRRGSPFSNRDPVGRTTFLEVVGGQLPHLHMAAEHRSHMGSCVAQAATCRRYVL